MKVIVVSEDGKPKRMGFKCPGCDSYHHIPIEQDGEITPWGFNNNLDSPTFTPSILSYWEGKNNSKQQICHSFVTNGQIQFLNDCYHEFAGQTIILPEIDPDKYY